MSTINKQEILQYAHSMVVEYCVLNGDSFTNIANAITRDVYPTNCTKDISEFHLNIKKCVPPMEFLHGSVRNPHATRIHIVHFAQMKWISTLETRPSSMLPIAHHLILFFNHINIRSVEIHFTQAILEEFIVQCLMSTDPQNTEQWQQYLTRYCIPKDVCPNYQPLQQLCGKSKSSKEFREFLLNHSWKSFTNNLQRWCCSVLNALELSPDDALLSKIAQTQNKKQTVSQDDDISNGEAIEDHIANTQLTQNRTTNSIESSDPTEQKQDDVMIISTDDEEDDDIEGYPKQYMHANYDDMPSLERGTQSQSMQIEEPHDIEMFESTMEDDYDEKQHELRTTEAPTSNVETCVSRTDIIEHKEPPQVASNGFSLGTFGQETVATDCNPTEAVMNEQSQPTHDKTHNASRGRKRAYNEIEKSHDEPLVTHNVKRARTNSSYEEKENKHKMMSSNWPKWMKKGIELTVELSGELLFCTARKVSSQFVLIKITDEDAPDKYKNRQIKIYLKDKHKYKIERVMDMCDLTTDEMGIESNAVPHVEPNNAMEPSDDKEEDDDMNDIELPPQHSANHQAQLLTNRPLRAGGKHSVHNDLFDDNNDTNSHNKNKKKVEDANPNPYAVTGGNGRYGAAFKDMVENDEGVELEYDGGEWGDDKPSIFDTTFEEIKPTSHKMPEQLINTEFITNPFKACGLVSKKKKKRSRKMPWNNQEIEALIEGYEKYKRYVNAPRGKQGIWSYINKDPKFGSILMKNGRENANLCDKWRHLVQKKDSRIQHLVDNKKTSSKKKKQT